MDMFSFMMFMVMMKMFGNDLPHTIEYELRRPDLVAKYGAWAVGRAESVCPLDDSECVELEAARLQRGQLAKVGLSR